MISELESVYPPFRGSEIAAAMMALDHAIAIVEAEAVLTRSTGIAVNHQGPVIKIPAPPANGNDAHYGAMESIRAFENDGEPGTRQ
jgi:hypothetical protein